MNVTELKIAMIRKGMNQKALAKAAGIGEANLSHYIKGQRRMSLPTVSKIAKALDLTDEQILNIFIKE